MEAPDRDLFLLKEINSDTADDIIKGIIKVNIYDAEQESKIVGYERKPIRLHLCTPRGQCSIWFFNM